jgi:hypothetical protein
MYLENSDGMLWLLFTNSEMILKTRPFKLCEKDLENGKILNCLFHGNEENINIAHHFRSNV